MILRLHGFDFYINIDGCSVSKFNVNYVRDKDFSREILLTFINKKLKKLFVVLKRLANIN